MRGKATSIILVSKTNGKEINFSSIGKASQFLGVNKMKISRLLKGKGINDTNYFITQNE